MSHHILFLYATEHSGHKKAAEAVQKSLLQLDPRLTTSGIGFFTQHYPILGPLLFRFYIDIIQSVPNIWDYLYNSDDIASLTSEIRSFFHSFNVSKLNQILADKKPDIIVCTQAIPCSFIASEKQKGRIKVPLVGIITDFIANPYWPKNDVDCYCVPDEETREHLIKRNVPGNRIIVTGIPVDNSFIRKVPKDEARIKMGLNPYKATVLIMGGNHGLGQISDAVSKLVKTKKDVQFIVVTGYNRRLYRELAKKYSNNKHILIRSHAKSVSRLMDASDILISKPGGLTSSEAMAKLLPMIILSPLPGQEQKNTNYLRKHGVAEKCENIRNLLHLTENFIINENKIKKFQSNALKIGRPYASNSIAEKIIQLLHD